MRQPLPSAEQIARLPADGGPEFNRLIFETSPYLLLHARNPVDWYPWGPEALEKARAEDKPIFFSCGYSSCRWCHVMEREAFSDPQVAEVLAEHYVAVKVDREERPDLDMIYLRATEALSGNAGWPNNVWLTPAGKPWFAGTYFPAEDHDEHWGLRTLLEHLAGAWRERRAEVEQVAERVTGALQSLGELPAGSGPLGPEPIGAGLAAIARTYDARFGGLGRAPKFPPHGALRLLLHEQRRSPDAQGMKMITHTLEMMARRGLYDHVGGGFYRYCIGARWLVPHFEKMAYDNGQLLGLYAEAAALTGNPDWRQVVSETAAWAERELADPAGGYCSALDAESEEEEGRYYLWSTAEVEEALGPEEAALLGRVYNLSEPGNFHDEASGQRIGLNILYLEGSWAEVAEQESLPESELRARMAAARDQLAARRAQRVPPRRDDKVLAAWNGLMISGLARAAHLLDEPQYLAQAGRAADFVLTHMRQGDHLLRSWREGRAHVEAYLDDYGLLAEGLLELHRAGGESRRLEQARELVEVMLEHFRDPQGGGFFYTPDFHEPLLVRPQPALDEALPSGNGAAAGALVGLAQATGEERYREAAGQALEACAGVMQTQPRGSESLLLTLSRHLDPSG